MEGSNPKSSARLLGHPIHPMLVPFPIAFFTAVFLADLAYWLAPRPFWAEAGFWLLAAGLVGAALAALAGFTDFAGDRRIRALGDARQHMIGNLLAVVIEAANFGLRLGDPAGALPSPGIFLSAAAFFLLGFTGWKGGELVFRHRVGVADARDRD